MEERYCKNDGKLIPTERRADAKFCCDQCGWKYRNRKNREANKEKQPHSYQLEINYKIVKDLDRRGKLNVSIEAMELLGFDFDYCTGIENIDYKNGIMEFRIFEYILTTHEGKCKIKKISYENA